MSRNNGKSPRIDLRLNLSRSRGGPSRVEEQARNNNNQNSPHRSSTSSSSAGSPASSCVSSDEGEKREPTSPGASMVLVGCPRCMMYVMLSEHDPKCPKCKSNVLVDFQRGQKKN